MKTETHSTTYGATQIEFEVQRKNVKNININVRPDMRVVVSASQAVPLTVIYDMVQSKAPWIIKNIRYFKAVQGETTAKKYLSGETFKYLGKQYRLKVEQADGNEKVQYVRGYLYLSVKDTQNYSRKEKLINDWYKMKALEKYTQSLNRVFPLVEKAGMVKPTIQMRTMKARWGSCAPEKQTIVLNRELIKAPKLCIDYVVLHELVHLKYRNHDDDFYIFLTALMPDWKQRKAILDEEVVMEL